ncbi:MAG: hypothetical protein ABR907_09155 [Terracidiphilus sp.]
MIVMIVIVLMMVVVMVMVGMVGHLRLRRVRYSEAEEEKGSEQKLFHTLRMTRLTADN